MLDVDSSGMMFPSGKEAARWVHTTASWDKRDAWNTIERKWARFMETMARLGPSRCVRPPEVSQEVVMCWNVSGATLGLVMAVPMSRVGILSSRNSAPPWARSGCVSAAIIHPQRDDLEAERLRCEYSGRPRQ